MHLVTQEIFILVGEAAVGKARKQNRGWWPWEQREDREQEKKRPTAIVTGGYCKGRKREQRDLAGMLSMLLWLVGRYWQHGTVRAWWIGPWVAHDVTGSSELWAIGKCTSRQVQGGGATKDWCIRSWGTVSGGYYGLVGIGFQSYNWLVGNRVVRLQWDGGQQNLKLKCMKLKETES